MMTQTTPSSIITPTTSTVTLNQHSNHYHHNHQSQHNQQIKFRYPLCYFRTTIQLLCITILLILTVNDLLFGGQCLVYGHSPPRAINYNVPLLQLAQQLMRSKINNRTQQQQHDYYNSNRFGQRLTDPYSLMNQQRLLNQKLLVGETLLNEQDPEYFQYKHHPVVPSCDQLRKWWLEEKTVNVRGELKATPSAIQEPVGVEHLKEHNQLQQLSKLIPKDQQVYITKIESDNKPDTDVEYGIVHKGPEEEENPNPKPQITTDNNKGVFGKFLDEIVQRESELEKQKYLNGYNLRSGKQSVKVRDRVNNNRGKSRTSGSHFSRQTNAAMFPGIFHDKPVKPSIRII